MFHKMESFRSQLWDIIFVSCFLSILSFHPAQRKKWTLMPSHAIKRNGNFHAEFYGYANESSMELSGYQSEPKATCKPDDILLPCVVSFDFEGGWSVEYRMQQVITKFGRLDIAYGIVELGQDQAQSTSKGKTHKNMLSKRGMNIEMAAWYSSYESL